MPIADYFIRGFEAQKQAQQAQADRAFRLRQLQALQDYRDAQIALQQEDMDFEKSKYEQALAEQNRRVANPAYQGEPTPEQLGGEAFGRAPFVRQTPFTEQRQVRAADLPAMTDAYELGVALEGRERANQPIPVPKFLQSKLGEYIDPANRGALGAIYSGASNVILGGMQRGGGGGGDQEWTDEGLKRVITLYRARAQQDPGVRGKLLQLEAEAARRNIDLSDTMPDTTEPQINQAPPQQRGDQQIIAPMGVPVGAMLQSLGGGLGDLLNRRLPPEKERRRRREAVLNLLSGNPQ